MISINIQYENGQCVTERCALPLLIGRAEDCGLRVKHWRVGKHHCLLRQGVNGVYIEDLGSLSGTRVNGRRITRYGPIQPSDACIVGPCKLLIAQPASQKAVEVVAAVNLATTPDSAMTDGNASEISLTDVIAQDSYHQSVKHLDAHPLSQMPEAHQDSKKNQTNSTNPINQTNQTNQTNQINQTNQTSPINPIIPINQTSTHTQTSTVLQNSVHDLASYQAVDQYIDIRQVLHAALIQALDLRRHDVSTLSDQALRQEAEKCVAVLIKNYPEIDTQAKQQELITLVSAEAVGLGILESLLDDPSISEIMVNRFDLIYIERFGKIQRHPASFSSDMAVRCVIDRIVFPLGRRIDESSPMVDARLKDGSRLNAVIPPIALHGACLTIRKFAQTRLGMHDLVARQALDAYTAEFLQLCINMRLNIIVSGGTGSGKTTLLNILGQCITPEQRIVTIEDSAELQIGHPHVLSLESRPVNAEGSGMVTIRDLVRNAMRMRPDRIIVGEVRGAEALDMLVAMNTGHEGSLTTLHANSPRDALARIETLVLMSNVGLPLQAIREQIASAVNIIIQQTRLPCGRRLISHIAEITGTESGIIQIQTLIRFDIASQVFVRNSLPPCFFDRVDIRNDVLIRRWFASP